MPEYQLTCPRFTVWVQTDTNRGTITDAAPLIRRFIGQPLVNLEWWAYGFGEIRLLTLDVTREREADSGLPQS